MVGADKTAAGEETTAGPLDGALVDLGRAHYQEAYDYQLDTLARVQRDEGVDTLILVEHPHVITVGRSRGALDNVLTPGEVEVVPIERGGDATYHGPGQLVGYPIVKLRDGERDLHRFLRNLEQAMIDTLADFGLESGRVDGKTGVWTGPSGAERKLASIGIACRKWVTFHGLALNVNTDLTYFHRINPCGFESAVMTSMQAELGGGSVDFESVKRSLAEHLGAALGRAFL